MLYNLAWKFARKYPYPNEEQMFEDCKSESYFAFMRACEKYQSDRGAKFITWCYKRVWFDLKTFVTARAKCPLEFVEIHEDLLGGKETLDETYSDLMQHISEDAKEIVALLVESPVELMEWKWGGCPKTSRELLRKVKDFLVAKRGRNLIALDAATRELKAHFRWNTVDILG